jgi:phthalate 3,4-cis-dihydrodiol dehydrogenase
MERDPGKCAQLERELPNVHVYQGDACSADDAVQTMEMCRERLGGLDVLVNCVGIFDFYRSLAQIDLTSLPRAFDELFRINVLGQLVPARAALDLLRASKGSMILTASSSAFYPGRGGILYVASKFAIRGAVLSLAHELAPDIRVNCVAPGGVIGTDLRGTLSLGQESQRVRADADRQRDLENLTPLKIAMRSPDVAGCYVFLASTEARGMTGECLHPDGGMGIRA